MKPAHLALVFVIGCGAAARTSSAPSQSGAAPGQESTAVAYEEEESEEAAEEPEQLVENLLASMQTGETNLQDALRLANCPGARDLRDAICEIARNICEIAERHQSDATYSEECADGRERCERATRSVHDRCG